MINITDRIIFNTSAIIEIIIGVGLIIFPGSIIDFLLGDGLTIVGISVARIAGVALISLGVSALEILNQPIKQSTRIGLLIYNFGAAILFLILATVYMMDGVLIWPTIGLHFFISLLICKTFWKLNRDRMVKND